MLVNEELERCRRVREELCHRYKTLEGLCAHLRKIDRALGIVDNGGKPRRVALRNSVTKRRKAS